jgi:hypothetical protein
MHGEKGDTQSDFKSLWITKNEKEKRKNSVNPCMPAGRSVKQKISVNLIKVKTYIKTL